MFWLRRFFDAALADLNHFLKRIVQSIIYCLLPFPPLQTQQRRTMAASHWARMLVTFIVLHFLLVMNEYGPSFRTAQAALTADAPRLQKESKRAAENMKKQQQRTNNDPSRKANNPPVTKSQTGRKNDKTSGTTDSSQKKKSSRVSGKTKDTSNAAVTGSSSGGGSSGSTSGKGKASSSNVFLGGELNRWNQGDSDLLPRPLTAIISCLAML